MIETRADNQTVVITDAVTAILDKLNNDYGQKIDTFTSAEFALEMVKGVVQVEFQKIKKTADAHSKERPVPANPSDFCVDIQNAKRERSPNEITKD